MFAAHELSDHSASECDCCSTDPKPAIPHLETIQQECGCVPPVVIYLKLSSHLGDGSTLEYSLAKKITLQNITVIETVEQLLPKKLFVHFTKYEPPHTKMVGRTLVNFLKQYKIALFV